MVTPILPAGPAPVYTLLISEANMPEAKDYSLDGEDRDEWDRSWRAMPHRRLASPPKCGIGADLSGLGGPSQ